MIYLIYHEFYNCNFLNSTHFRISFTMRVPYLQVLSPQSNLNFLSFLSFVDGGQNPYYAGACCKGRSETPATLSFPTFLSFLPSLTLLSLLLSLFSSYVVKYHYHIVNTCTVHTHRHTFLLPSVHSCYPVFIPVIKLYFSSTIIT